MFGKRAVTLLLISLLAIASLLILFWLSYYSSQQDKELKILLEMCSKAVESFRGDSVWRPGSVLVFNRTSFTEGLIRKKVIYNGKHYNIVISNETHIVIYAASVGQYSLYSKGFFYEVDAIAIS